MYEKGYLNKTLLLNVFIYPISLFPLSLEQLGFNALLQLMIGVPLEMVHGILRISLLYMAGVLAGECLLKHVYYINWWFLMSGSHCTDNT